MTPPSRFADATFARYAPETPSQAAAADEARAFVQALRAEPSWQDRLRGWLGRRPRRPHGLYLVGPVGTGKTHLLAAMYHALHPDVPCAFLHSSSLFRAHAHPEAYARELATQYDVLCLDEVELDDPANEARLVLVLKTLDALGVTLLATSNVEPERFLSAAFGGDRFRRFLTEEFRQTYRVLLVRGDDYRRRLDKPGLAWIGPASLTTPAMERAYEAEEADKEWLPFGALLQHATDIEHTRLVGQLAAYDALFVADIAIRDTDDALRLLRIVDDLYLRPDPPTLYFTARTAPDTWLRADEQHGGLERGIAEKFERTVSRLHALCQVQHLEAPVQPSR